MATGASGRLTSEGWSGNTGDVVMTVTWTQEYTPGNTYSDVKISAQCKRNGTNKALGGTWFADSDGGIKVNGTRACGWYKNQSGSWTNNGDVGWSGSGSVRINHTAATNVTINIDSVEWYNSSYSSSSFTIPSKSESVTLNAVPQPYTLSISAGSGSWITVTKNGSTLSNGASIYSGDVLTISGGANTGYNFGGLTVNGAAFTSGTTYTVSSAVTVASTATAKSYSLSISAGTGSTITVNRTSSQYGGGATGALSNGATIYYGDALKIDFTILSGYKVETTTVNGETFISGNTHTVTSNVTVVSTAVLDIPRYQMYIDNGITWCPVLPYIDVGSAWSGSE